jgi:hypothetical protein
VFTRTTQQGRDEAPIQAPALNSTIWGGLAAAVTAVGAATAGLFTAMDVTEWEVRVAIVAGVTAVIAIGLWAVVALVRNDIKTRLTAVTADGKTPPVTAAPEEPEGSIAWITPPPMHLYSTADTGTPLQVILVGLDKDKVYYYAAAERGRPKTLTADEVHHVQLDEALNR